ncbi:hypothetical protein [Roseateles saccharophilus]|uniref:NIPSNAP protein n=1 Tax=Roseateles saccharophilus TaxID=304 RepID=A0A4R3VEK7_ROSSA|nr:hypothetical protein [Roseateles saccharophilus]MDG0831783.1 hypothetical protein [Roseateles saccharophilus]TCV01195.1 hypothetical protein EV671_1006121 [Roseateles saccharophilus]
MQSLSKTLLALTLAGASTLGWAQDAKPYKDGPVTEVSYIKIKPGRFDDYMQFLSTTYRANMEAQKKAGLILGYRIFGKQARTPQDPDLILTITYANMAALDRTDEAEAVMAKVLGNNAAQNKATIERGPMREVLGSELIRELVLK